MAQYFGLFLGNSTGYGDIPQEIPGSRKRKDVRGLIFMTIFAIQGPNPGVRQNGDADRAASRARRDAGEPRTQAFRAGASTSLFDYAHLDGQTCPPFPVNDS
jgi:hypothetical protein